MSEKKLEILHQSMRLFMKYGLKSLSMDDLASEIKVSKKTLYKYFDDKESLIASIMSTIKEDEIKVINQICNTSENAIEEVLEINKMITAEFNDINPSVKFDLEKYYRKAWEVLNDYKFGFIYNCVVENIKRGIKEGYYRKDIKEDIIATMYVLRADYIIDGDHFPKDKMNLKEINHEVVKYHLCGLVNDKGMEYLKKNVL